MIACRTKSVVCFALSLASAAPVAAAIPEIAWEAPETVDAPVEEVSTSTGASIIEAEGLWLVVYEKSGEIFMRARADTGWRAPEPVSTDPSASRAPHVALAGGDVHVVWEDERSGLAEVWTRRWDGASWSPQECLSCDAVASRAPAVGGEGGVVFAAWEEDAGGGTAIVGRRFEAGAWTPVEPVSASTGLAIEPSVVVHPGSESVSVLWSDSRHGDAEIYLRRWLGAWADEQRMTEAAGSCRRPSAHAQECCPDIAYDVFGFAFENDQSGVPEVLGACWTEGIVSVPEPLSAIDGVASARPNLTGFNFVISIFPFGSLVHTYLPTWTDGAPSLGAAAVISHSEGCVSTSSDTAIVSSHAMSYTAAGAVEGIPNAEVLVAWVEEREEVRTLVAQRGSLLGYVGVDEGNAAGEAPRLSVTPNPARSQAAFRIESPAPARADVRVVDAAGRVVRRLGQLALTPGANVITWDTTDDNGDRVAAGRYFATVRVADATLREKIVIAR